MEKEAGEGGFCEAFISWGWREGEGGAVGRGGSVPEELRAEGGTLSGGDSPKREKASFQARRILSISTGAEAPSKKDSPQEAKA